MSNTKGKPGSIWFAVALVLALGAPAFWLIGAEHQARVDALRRDGLVTMATVEGKQRVEEFYTDSKGRRKSRTKTMIRLRYDHEAEQSYAAWEAAGEPALPARAEPIPVSYDRQSTTAEFDAARPGQRLPVVIMPGDRSTAETAEFVKSYDSFWTKVAGVVCGLMALVTLAAGWRARRLAAAS